MDSDYISPYLFNLPKQEDNPLELDWSSLLQDQITSPYGTQLNQFASLLQPNQHNIFQYSNNYDHLVGLNSIDHFYSPVVDYEFSSTSTAAAVPLLEVGNYSYYNNEMMEIEETNKSCDTTTSFVENGSSVDGGRVKKRMSCGNLEYEEIQKYFGVPISRAAKELKVGLTVLKRRCRELNIMRWPHRKIKSLDSLIKNVQEMGLMEELGRLEQHKQLLALLPDMELTERTKKLRQACFKANYKKRRASNFPLLC